MIIQNILVSQLKIINSFKQPFYSLISTIKCQDDSLRDLRENYMFFARRLQKESEDKTENFSKYLNITMGDLGKELKLESISLVNGNDSNIIKEWKNLNSEESIDSYNEEIKSTLLPNLTKDGDKIQIKIKVNEKVKEFIFWEFIVSGNSIKYINHGFSTQKECYLDYFPKEFYPIKHLFYFEKFCDFVSYLFDHNCGIEYTYSGENIKNATIKTSFSRELFTVMKDFENLGVFKFKDFNLSIKQSKAFNKKETSLEQVTWFFDLPKSIPKISFDVLFSSMVRVGTKKEEGVKRIFFDISKRPNTFKEIPEYTDFSLGEIQKEENSLKVILCRPTEGNRNPIKAKDSLYIEFLDLWADAKSVKISMDAEEKIERNLTLTLFTVKKRRKQRKKLEFIRYIDKGRTCFNNIKRRKWSDWYIWIPCKKI